MKNTLYCLGDSNTWGYDPRSPFGDRYRETWCTLLGQALSCPVCCDGVNGRELSHVTARYALFKKKLLSEEPAHLILLLGTNDILRSDTPEPSQIAAEMEALLEKIRADFPALPVFLLSPPDIRIPGPFRQAAAVLSGYYKALSLQYGTEFLSLSSLPLAWDGVHLSEEGHAQLARMLYLSLRCPQNP